MSGAELNGLVLLILFGATCKLFRQKPSTWLIAIVALVATDLIFPNTAQAVSTLTHLIETTKTLVETVTGLIDGRVMEIIGHCKAGEAF